MQVFHDSYQGTIGCTPEYVLEPMIFFGTLEKKHWILRIGQPTETLLSSHGMGRICDGFVGHSWPLVIEVLGNTVTPQMLANMVF